VKKDYLLFIGVALIILLLDQASKWMAVTHIQAHQALSVIPGF